MLDEVTGSMCNPWTFRMTWNMDQCYQAVQILARDSGVKTWASVGPNYGFGQESSNYFSKYGPARGGLTFEQGIFTP
jgi:branched-chain amino acid transport system substrate-binding protein